MPGASGTMSAVTVVAGNKLPGVGLHAIRHLPGVDVLLVRGHRVPGPVRRGPTVVVGGTLVFLVVEDAMRWILAGNEQLFRNVTLIVSPTCALITGPSIPRYCSSPPRGIGRVNVSLV
jgi:hypothetical protein